MFHIFTSKMYKTCKTPLLHKNILSIWFSSPQDNEKAVDEMRKFYSAQAVKHKEKMEQAVNYKACESLLHCGITVCESIHVLLIGAIWVSEIQHNWVPSSDQVINQEFAGVRVGEQS